MRTILLFTGGSLVNRSPAPSDTLRFVKASHFLIDQRLLKLQFRTRT